MLLIKKNCFLIEIQGKNHIFIFTINEILEYKVISTDFYRIFIFLKHPVRVVTRGTRYLKIRTIFACLCKRRKFRVARIMARMIYVLIRLEEAPSAERSVP